MNQIPQNSESNKEKSKSPEPESRITNENNDKKETNIFSKLKKFLFSHTVYESIPENMKILVFNNELAIKLI